MSSTTSTISNAGHLPAARPAFATRGRRLLVAALLSSPLLALSMPASGAETSQWPTAATPEVLPRPDFHFPGNVGRTIADSDPPQFPQPVPARPTARRTSS